MWCLPLFDLFALFVCKVVCQSMGNACSGQQPLLMYTMYIFHLHTYTDPLYICLLTEACVCLLGALEKQ